MLEERRTTGVDGDEKASHATAKKDAKRITGPAYWATRCCSSKMTMVLMPIVLMQIVLMVAKGSLASPIELKNQTQDDTANCTDSHPPLPDEHWVTSVTVSESAEYASYNQNKTHSGKRLHTCRCCGKILPTPSKLKVHMRKHTGKKPYNCIQCDKKFGTLGSLRRHCRIHTGEKPFKCDQCNSSFGQKMQLQMHMQIHTGEKPYVCGQCSKKFRRLGDLKRHYIVHTGEKSFKCDRCNSSFGLKNNLQTHMRIHTGEMPFKCGYCSLSFRWKTSLQRHMQIHTGENTSATFIQKVERSNVLNLAPETREVAEEKIIKI